MTDYQGIDHEGALATLLQSRERQLVEARYDGAIPKGSMAAAERRGLNKARLLWKLSDVISAGGGLDRAWALGVAEKVVAMVRDHDLR